MSDQSEHRTDCTEDEADCRCLTDPGKWPDAASPVTLTDDERQYAYPMKQGDFYLEDDVERIVAGRLASATPAEPDADDPTAGERECCWNYPHAAHETPCTPDAGDVEAGTFAWLSDSLCVDVSRVVSAEVVRAPLPRYSGQFLGGRRDVVLTLDTGEKHVVTAVDEDTRRRGYESSEPTEQRERVEIAARAWVVDLLGTARIARSAR